MDTPQTPPNAGPETGSDGYTEPWAAIAAGTSGSPNPVEASPPAPADEGTTAPQAPETGVSESDPYQPDFTADEWDAMAAEARMDVGELRSVFAPAREVTHSFGGPELEALLNSDDPVFGALGNDPDLIRGLGSFGEQLRVYTRGEAQLIQELTALAQQTGQPFSPPTVAPLTGQALDAAIDQLLARHIPNTGARQAFEAAGIFRHPAVRRMLERMARQEHRALQSLTALDRTRSEWRERERTMSPSNQPSNSRPQASKAELQAQYDELFLEWHTAKQGGDMLRAQVLNDQLKRLAPQAFA